MRCFALSVPWQPPAPSFFVKPIGVRIATALLGLILLAVPSSSCRAADIDQHGGDKPIDATSLRGKVLCGYQGWFRCPGDPSKIGWIHWSRDPLRITPHTLSFDMWPDLAEYTPTERFAASGFTYPDGRQAELFSSEDVRLLLASGGRKTERKKRSVRTFIQRSGIDTR
jgi:hypothetical protein